MLSIEYYNDSNPLKSITATYHPITTLGSCPNYIEHWITVRNNDRTLDNVEYTREWISCHDTTQEIAHYIAIELFNKFIVKSAITIKSELLLLELTAKMLIHARQQKVQ